MGELTCCEKVNAWLRNSKVYLLIISLQFGSAGMYVLTMDALNKGMSHYVFVVYRNVIATVALAPFAFFLERKIRPKMTVRIFSEIMALGFVELERMKLREIGCQAKVIGTVVSLGGAFLMALYKGPVLQIVGSSAATQMHQPENVNDPTGSHWLLGALFLLIGCAGFSAFYILQAITLRKYPAEMSLATWVCFIGALQSSAVTIFMERHSPEAWALGLDSRLFASGIVTSAIQFYVQGSVIKTMGPVFVTAFNPLRMIIVTALACIVLSEKLHLGSIVGGVVVVTGLYLVVWGKSKEQKSIMLEEESPQKISQQGQQQLPITVSKIDDNVNINKAQLVTIIDPTSAERQ
ncbi:hypothetical protein RYX36_021964 [Vicia faba]